MDEAEANGGGTAAAMAAAAAAEVRAPAELLLLRPSRPSRRGECMRALFYKRGREREIAQGERERERGRPKQKQHVLASHVVFAKKP